MRCGLLSGGASSSSLADTACNAPGKNMLLQSFIKQLTSILSQNRFSRRLATQQAEALSLRHTSVITVKEQYKGRNCRNHKPPHIFQHLIQKPWLHHHSGLHIAGFAETARANGSAAIKIEICSLQEAGHSVKRDSVQYRTEHLLHC